MKTEAREQGQEAPLEAARASSPTVRLGKVEWRHVIKEAELLTGEASGLQTGDLAEESNGLLCSGHQERAGLAGPVPNLGKGLALGRGEIEPGSLKVRTQS